ncbi:MAG: serine hydrolase [Saprospiraceae bacterium]|nr:serine hydrolase [Saprospiraceae bacterium]
MMVWLVLMLVVMALVWLLWRRPFVLRSLRMAYHSGRLGPAIDEQHQFANKQIVASDPKSWKLHPAFGTLTLPSKSVKVNEDLGTTAFLVLYKKQLLFEQYWPPFSADVPTNSFSVAKSVVSTLIGFSAREGILDLDDPVANYLQGFRKNGKEQITIRHLLTMSSGLSWNESEGNLFSDNAEAYYGWDTAAMINRLRVERTPGEVFEYASINTQILAQLLKVVTGESVAELVQNWLWPVIGSEHDAFWNLDRPGGEEKAFCCLYAVPRDFARLGQLYLNGGSWNGTQLIDPSFVDASWTALPLFDSWTNQTNASYGMHWWMASYQGHTYYYARGIRGQYVICDKARDLIIVRIGHRRNPVDRHHGHPPDLFDHIYAGVEIFTSIPQ